MMPPENTRSTASDRKRKSNRIPIRFPPGRIDCRFRKMKPSRAPAKTVPATKRLHSAIEMMRSRVAPASDEPALRALSQRRR